LLPACSLSIDAFAVALCIGATGDGTKKTAAMMGTACGAFQFFMPLAGWMIGVYTLGRISSIDHWVAFGLLAFVGGNMMRGSFSGESVCSGYSAATLRSLLSLALATSIDALAVGASFGVTGKPVLALAGESGLITLALCFAGVLFGRRVGNRLGKRSEFIGGMVLILIGLNILREHLVQ
jgi:putative Mn2+ efflux pump MntP